MNLKRHFSPHGLVGLLGVAAISAAWFFFDRTTPRPLDKEFEEILTAENVQERYGQWGDKFGALNCLFTGLGFIAVIATLSYHHDEGKKRETETGKLISRLERTAEALEKQADQTRRQVEIQADIALFEHWLVRYQHFAKLNHHDEQNLAWKQLEIYRQRIEARS